MQLSRIGRRPTPKRQAADTIASVAKVWSEWQLAKRAGKGLTKGAKTAGKAAIVWRALPVKALVVAGGAAAGIGALWAWRSRRGDAEPWAPPADDAASDPPPPPPAGSGLSGPAPPGQGTPERIKVASDPAAAVQAAQEGSNGAAQISDPPAADAAGESGSGDESAATASEPEAEADQPEAKPDPGAEVDKPEAGADSTKVSDKPADA